MWLRFLSIKNYNIDNRTHIMYVEKTITELTHC